MVGRLELVAVDVEAFAAPPVALRSRIGVIRRIDVEEGLLGIERRHQLEGIRLLDRSEEHTSELQSLMRISYAVFCLKKKKNPNVVRHKQEELTHTNVKDQNENQKLIQLTTQEKKN